MICDEDSSAVAVTSLFQREGKITNVCCKVVNVNTLVINENYSYLRRLQQMSSHNQ